MSEHILPRFAGIVIPTTDNAFFSRLAVEADRFLSRQGLTALILSSDNSAEKEKEHLQTLLHLGAAGILCVSGLSALPEDLLPASYPLVFLDRHPRSAHPVPLVANDDRAAMFEATSYLISLGCRHILLMPGYLAETRTSPRVIGYEEALLKNGLHPDPGYVLNRPGRQPSEVEAEALIREIMHREQSVDAIITSSDRAAFGVITALHRVGLYVPEDVRLICFDNSPYSSMASPAITALDRQPDLLAEKAARYLLDLMDGKAVPTETLIPVHLCKRDSTR